VCPHPYIKAVLFYILTLQHHSRNFDSSNDFLFNAAYTNGYSYLYLLACLLTYLLQRLGSSIFKIYLCLSLCANYIRAFLFPFFMLYLFIFPFRFFFVFGAQRLQPTVWFSLF